MVEIEGLSIKQIDRRADRFAAAVDAEMNRIMRQVADDLGQFTIARASPAAVSLSDLNPIKVLWEAVVNGRLIELLAAAMFSSSTVVTENLNRAVGRPVVEPIGEDTAVDLVMKTSRNYLVNIGDDLWTDASDALIEGMQEGESIDDLSDRVMEAVEVAKPRATVIARTEVLRACNTGSITTMRASELITRKKWLATPDDRTRPSHRAADGQEVDLDEPFIVGGSPLDHPLDPLGPPGETISCRCTMLYEVDESDFELPEEAEDIDEDDDDEFDDDEFEDDDIITAAANDDHETEGMIALVPTEADAERLALMGGEVPEQLHVTLAYLGEIIDWTDEQRNALIEDVKSFDWVDGDWNASVFGVNHWNPDGEDPVWVLAIAGDSLSDAHDAVWYSLSDLQARDAIPDVPNNHRPWVAHLTLAYDSDHNVLTEAVKRVGPVTFDRLRIALGSETTDVPLQR